MDFKEFLALEFDYPDEISEENIIFMVAAWNQSVINCRKIVKNYMTNNETINKLYDELDNCFYRRK